MHVCFIGALSCEYFTTNATYRLAQVKLLITTVIRFEPKVLPHGSCRVRL